MDRRPLGVNTGLEVSVLGLGTVKFGRNRGVKYPQAFALPSDDDLRTLLRVAREGGITLLDTAPAYGTAEERVGRLMTDPREGGRHDGRTWGWGGRDAWTLVTKVGESFDPETGTSTHDFRPAEVHMSVERSLERLRTDILDLVLVHSDGRDLDIIESEGTLEALRDLQRIGLIRAFGMSTKTVEGGLRAIQAGCDAVMVTWNPQHTEEGVVIEAAASAGAGVLVKKALVSGHLGGDLSGDVGGGTGGGDAGAARAKVEAGPTGRVPDAAACLRFALQREGVSSVVVGTINPDHLRANIAAAAGACSPG